MAEKNNDKSLEERGVKALESIANSLGEINDWVYDLDADMWQERLEWYLNEFYQIAKSKTVGTSNKLSYPMMDTSLGTSIPFSENA